LKLHPEHPKHTPTEDNYTVPSGDLEKSLRADIDSYVSGRLSGLQEEVARLQSQFNEAFTRLLERMDTAGSDDDSLAVAVSDHLRHARNQGIETAAAESTRARMSSDIALIKAAVEEIEAQHTQADILNVLVNRSASFAPRVAFFVVKSDRATGWRARGLEGTVGDDTVRELSLAVSSDTLLGRVVRARTTWAGGPGAHAEDHTIYGRFGEEPPQRLVAVPLVARDKAVAVLYADSAGLDAEAVNLEALETLVRVAGMAVELLASRRGAPVAHEAAPAPASHAEPRHAEATHAEPRQAETTPAPVEESRPSAAEEAPARVEFESAPPPSNDWGARAEVSEPAVSEPAPAPPAPQPEPATAFAPAAPQAEVSPLGASSRRYGAADMEFPVEVNEDEKRYHNEARRFARLLVSEIKLYNEPKVREGREAGDLYQRLRDDIDRSRQMYDKRVRPEVSGRYDYFHHELVTMLAEGDASRLGEGYPGATA
jgi:hypothetical protein